MDQSKVWTYGGVLGYRAWFNVDLHNDVEDHDENDNDDDNDVENDNDVEDHDDGDDDDDQNNGFHRRIWYGSQTLSLAFHSSTIDIMLKSILLVSNFW